MPHPTQYYEAPESLPQRVARVEENLKSQQSRIETIEEGVNGIRNDIQTYGFRILIGLASVVIALVGVLGTIVLTKDGLLH